MQMATQKKKNSLIKGDKLEKICKEALVRVFTYVEGPPVKTRFARRDYFGLFDFIVLDDYGEMIGIQVSTRKIYDKGRDFRNRWEAWPGKKAYASSEEELISVLSSVASSTGNDSKHK